MTKFKYIWKLRIFNAQFKTFFSDFKKPPIFILGEGYRLIPVLGFKMDIYSSMFPSSYPKGISTDIRIYSSGGFFLRLSIVYVSFAETATKNQLIQVRLLQTIAIEWKVLPVPYDTTCRSLLKTQLTKM